MPELFHLPGFDDPFSAISHLCGAVLFVVLGALLLRRGRGDRARVALLGVYAFACVALFALSGTYHMMTVGGTARRVMQRLDHAAIFVLIAGTFTPAHGILFRGPMRWVPLVLVWSAAAFGIVLKGAYMDAVPESVGLSIYLATGWLGAVAVVVLWRRHGWAFVRPLALGGVAYTAGAATEFLFRWPVLVPGVIHPHEVFHVAVLAGALWHFAFIWRFADGRVPDPVRPGRRE
ncbi:MAG TPA: hemolysin III family protein [Humisphaera sp.]